jgi:hypothetical protein
MTDEIKPGDAVELIHAGRRRCTCGVICLGSAVGKKRYRTVLEVEPLNGPEKPHKNDCTSARLHFSDKTFGVSWRFRKIPSPKKTRDDETVINLMKGTVVPVKEGVN